MSVRERSHAAAAGEIKSGAEHRRDARTDWRIADQVVLDLELPHLNVQAAIQARDESSIWRAYHASHDQGAWLDGLATCVGSHAFERPHFRDPSRTTPWHHVLIAWPVLLPAQGHAMPRGGSDDGMVARGLLDKLHAWLDYRYEARLVACVTGYDELCRWSPISQRECLQLLARQTHAWRAALRPDTARLPPDWPRLAFVIGSVAEWIVQPQFPTAGDSPSKDWELQLQTAARTGYAQRCRVAAEHVGVPATFAAAVLDGLRGWLGEVARLELVRSWRIEPGRDDMVWLKFGGGGEELPAAAVPLRLHQIGQAGLHLLAVDLFERLGPAETRGRWHA